MNRVHIIVEGQTEETFVRTVMAPYFFSNQIFLNAIVVQTSKSQRGGMTSYSKIRPQILLKCKEDPKSWVTTMFDLYALASDFPGNTMRSQVTIDPLVHAMKIETSVNADINQPNFFANLTVHEFEALLFSDTSAFGGYFGDWAASQLSKQRQSFSSPEHINTSLAPSKRILDKCDNYRKIFHGSSIAMDIGLDAIRTECSHFHSWLDNIALCNT